MPMGNFLVVVRFKEKRFGKWEIDNYYSNAINVADAILDTEKVYGAWSCNIVILNVIKLH